MTVATWEPPIVYSLASATASMAISAKNDLPAVAVDEEADDKYPGQTSDASHQQEGPIDDSEKPLTSVRKGLM